MKLKRKTINTPLPPLSLHWKGDQLIDSVSGGNIFNLEGNLTYSNRSYAYEFDSVIHSTNGVYSILYKNSGTKGIILKNGELIREINRSYYQAHAYEYPVCIIKLEGGEYGLVHCPNHYNLIEIEHIETGQAIIAPTSRTPGDCFHSRLRTNPSSTKLITAGWVWHPYGVFQIYDLKEGFQNASIFDSITNKVPINSEICSAEFLTDDLIYISSTFEEPLDDEDDNETLLNPGEIGLYSISKNKFIKKFQLNQQSGNLLPLDEDYVIDLFKFPKLIDMNKEKIITKFEDINSGDQTSSIIWDGKFPPVALDRDNKRIAIGGHNKIELLSYS